jgi:hypothetical protein
LEVTRVIDVKCFGVERREPVDSWNWSFGTRRIFGSTELEWGDNTRELMLETIRHLVEVHDHENVCSFETTC